MHETVILIVEDNIISAEGLRDRLINHGYTVPNTISSGEEAIQQISRIKPNIIIMDIRLSGKIDGIDTAKIIKEQYDIPIIYLTAYTDESMLERAKETGPYNYLVKPIRDRELLVTLEMVLNRYKIENELKMYKDQLEKLVEERTAELQMTNEKYRVLVDNSQDHIYSLNTRGEIVSFNKELKNLIGLTPTEIVGRKIFSIYNPEDPELWDMYMRHVVDFRESISFNFDILLKSGSKEVFQVNLSPLLDSTGEIVGITGTNHNITPLVRKEEMISQLAYYDILTDLPNRKLFQDRVNTAIKISARTMEKLALIFIDVDDFKKINDTEGHQQGDIIIKEIGQDLLKHVRESDTLARMGGDEFTILMQNISDITEAVKLVERIKEIFKEKQYITKKYTHFISASIGIAIYPEDGTTYEELLKNADTAMYKAKEKGKNSYQIYNTNMKDELQRTVILESSLRRAIEFNELAVNYQPQYGSDGEIRGFEALMRWNSRQYGVISPVTFIPVAEKSGLIISFGDWILEKACRNNKEWQEKTQLELVISVNISLIQIRQKNFVDRVIEIVEKTKLLPKYLELEITESVLIDDFEGTVGKLKALKAAGIKISLDDFGTGYSSLNYLKKLPLDSVKIDKTFIDDIGIKDRGKSIVGTIINLAHDMDLDVIAEGVETEEQYRYLIKYGCDYIQGYYLSRPREEKDVERLIKEQF